MEKGIDRIIDIVEDHAVMCGFLEELSCYIKARKDGLKLPKPFLPHLNSTVMMDVISTVAEKVVE